jgi:hypothetical protein
MTSFALSEGRPQNDDFPSRALLLNKEATFRCATLFKASGVRLTSQTGPGAPEIEQPTFAHGNSQPTRRAAPSSRFHPRL